MKYEKDEYHVISHTWNLKYDPNELIYKPETDSHTQRTDLWLPRGGVRDGWTGSWGLVDANYTGWINSKVLYSTENYIQQPVINHNTNEYEKEHIYV